MSVYRRGSSKVWWFKFKFRGQLIQQSARTSNVKIARDAERERRQQLERAAAGVPLPAPPMLFRNAAKTWLDNKAGKRTMTVRGYTQRTAPLVTAFGTKLLSDITCQDVLTYRAKRIRICSNRTVNYELICLRGILGKQRWVGFETELAQYGQKSFHLEERHDVGKAMSFEDELGLIPACVNSVSLALYPLFIMAIDSGLRAAEKKALRRRDLRLTIEHDVIVDGELAPPKSKSKKGENRPISFTPRVCAALTHWLRRFPNAGPDSYVFPHHEIRQVKGSKVVEMHNVDLNRPMSSWQTAWRTAQKNANVSYRWHDLRHTFVTRLCENPAVSEQTIRDLVGHVSEQMLKRYSHIRREVGRGAIRALASSVAAEHSRVLAEASETKNIARGPEGGTKRGTVASVARA